jgi:hypothetical protein
MGFVVDKVALGQAFLGVLRFSLSLSIHRRSPNSHRLGDEQYARQWQQFRDVVSSHKKDNILTSVYFP